MKEEHINEIKAIIVLALGMIFFASLISFVPEDLPWYTPHPNVPAQNLIRITGAYLAGAFLFVFGYSAYVLVFLLFFWSWNKFTGREMHFSVFKLVGFLVLFSVVSGLLGLGSIQYAVGRFERAGFVGLVFSDFLLSYVGRTGAYIVFLALGVMGLILTGEFLVKPLFLECVDGCNAFSAWLQTHLSNRGEKKPAVASRRAQELEARLKAPQQEKKKPLAPVRPVFAKPKDEDDEDDDYDPSDEEDEGSDVPAVAKPKPVTPKIHIAKSSAQKGDAAEKELLPEIVGEYRLPALDLLENPPQVSNDKIQEDLIGGAKLLEETLASFGVAAHVADIERGPAITRYELEPGPGVKVQKFTTLSDDIALAMRAATVRVVAPIPGKNRVGIEVPNAGPASVYLKDVLSSNEFKSAHSKLTLSLGKSISGESMVADLAEMPHLLIAGTTGSGKTVCVNGIILSILFNAAPDEVKLVLVDPKMVEMAQYNDIPHLLSPTVTDPKKAAAVLYWVVGEMESRYKRLSKANARNIKAYNEQGNKMPYIVVVIDELADLMQVSAKAVESSITRLAQLSRAVGIHLILATQRPSVDVITGVIKANFPARISFKVASKVDSRTVLDMNGAESLLGKGDMLFIKPGDAKPTRGQCSFVRDAEINRVIQFIKDQQAPVYDETILHQQKTGEGGPGGDEGSDEFYDEAVRLVIETNQASVSILQRRLRLGYTRAARLIDMMEQNGLVGPYCGSKPREILVDREQWLLENMKEKEDKNND